LAIKQKRCDTIDFIEKSNIKGDNKCLHVHDTRIQKKDVQCILYNMPYTVCIGNIYHTVGKIKMKNIYSWKHLSFDIIFMYAMI
jgi:hypothetical protein